MGITKFTFEKQDIEGLQVITPFIAEDYRGAFRKMFEKEIFYQHGIDFEVSEMMESISAKGVIRGLHMQHTHPQAKLVRVVSGEVFDVAVDIRKGSKTYGQYFSIYLSGENKKMLYIPSGFLHGFISLAENTVFNYLCCTKYYPEYDGGVVWNDKDINVQWPLDRVDNVILSDKDKMMPTLKEYEEKFL